jgi:hypothetical protein
MARAERMAANAFREREGVKPMPKWTEEEIALARRMLAEKQPDSEFRERLGRSKICAQRRFFRAHHYDDSIADWTRLGLRHEPRVDVPPDVRADANRRAAAPRTLSAWLCGDPAPGWSALDRRARS